MKPLAVSLLLMALAGTAGAAAVTDPVTFNLNYIIGGSGQTQTLSWGTLTITDGYDNDPKKVLVTIDVKEPNYSGSNVLKIQSVALNYLANSINSIPTTGWLGAETTASGGDKVTIGVSLNDVKADGYKLGYFDIDIPNGGGQDTTGGSLGMTPYSFWLALTGVNLDPGNFDYLAAAPNTAKPAKPKGGTTDDFFYAAVHIGSCDGDCYGGTSNSIWLGATKSGYVPPEVIPEPGTLALCGIALTGMAFTRRRRVR